MKELDLLLLRYLRRAPSRRPTSDERAAFAEFLELPDPDMARYLLAGDVPTDPRHAALCRALLRIELISCPRAARPRCGSHGSGWCAIVAVVLGRGTAVAGAHRHLCLRRHVRASAASDSCSSCAGRTPCGRCDWSEAGRAVRVSRARTARSHPPTLAAGSFRLGVSAAGFCGSKRLRRSSRGSHRWSAAGRRRPSGACAGVSTTLCDGFRAPRRPQLLPSGPRFEVRHAPLKIIRLDRARKETFAGVQGLFSSQGAGVLL